MVHTFKHGEKRRVWPRPGHRVLEGHDAQNFLPAEGKEVKWNDWWHARALDGSICFTDPTKNFTHAEHGKADKPASKAPALKPDASTSKAPADKPVKAE